MTDFTRLAVQDEKFINAYSKMYDFLKGQVSSFAGPDQSDNAGNLYRPIFEAGNALICAEYLGDSALMRDYNFDFGILPLPKYDNTQKNYHTSSQDSFSVFCVPATVANLDMVGAVTESMAAYTYNNVTPVLYELALKTKYTRDNESAEMIDIIKNSIWVNFNSTYALTLNVPGHTWRLGLINNRNSITSDIEKNMKTYSAGLQKILDSYNQ